MKHLHYNRTLLLAAALPIVALASCNKDDEPKLDPATPLYQQYEVYSCNGEVSAHANFRVADAQGERVYLNNGASVTVNNLKMVYYSDDFDPAPVYSYSQVLEKGTRDVSFRFQRSSGHVLTNSVSISDIDPVTFDTSIVEIKNGEAYDYSTGFKSETVSFRLVPKGENDFENAYTARLAAMPEGTTFSFSGVPAGVYILVADSEANFATTQNDGSATGVIHLVLRTTVTVNVTL